MQAKGYVTHLLAGWRLTVSAFDGDTIAWLTNDGVDTGFYETVMPGNLLIDLDRLGYVPTVYHDGGEMPPLVIFHAAQLDAPRYVWTPARGHIRIVWDGDHA